MYTREISAPQASPVENGNPIIGTWDKAFDRVDLLEIRRPYRYPLPRWVRDFRLKEWQCYSIHNDDYIIEAAFCDFKLYRIAQILLYDIKNQEKIIYQKVRPGSRHLPVSLSNSLLDSHSSGFYFRIHIWLDADTVKLDINIKATRRRPPLTAHLAFDISRQEVIPMAVSLGLTERRIMCAYKALAPVRGDMIFGGRHLNLKQETSSGFISDYKGLFPYNFQTTICKAMGFTEEKRRFGFHIAENQARNSNRNNENALWLDGKFTPLPPVLITMPNGINAGWVIQDVEGMVDLTFTPSVNNKNRLNFLITKVDFNAPMGFYNGMLVISEGEQLQIKNLFGVGEKLNLRV